MMEDIEEIFIKTSLYISHSGSLYTVLIRMGLNGISFMNLLFNFSCFLTFFHYTLKQKFSYLRKRI